MNILVDLDSVLVNWLQSACNLVGVDLDNPDIIARLKTERLENLVGKGAMWSAIHKKGEAFWEGLQPLPWCETLFRGLQQKVGDEHVFICTAPSSDAASAAGKIKWCRRYLKIPSERIVLTPSKWLLARKDSFLIDDTPKQVNRFRENGGGAFLWPNQLDILDGTLSYGKVLLDFSKEFDSWCNQ